MVARYWEIELGELAHLFDYRRLFASRRKRRRDDLRKVYRLGIGRSNRNDRSDLHRSVGVGDRNGVKTNSSCLARPVGRLRRGWYSIQPGVAVFFERCASSRRRNVNPACFMLPLVGGITLFADGETCGFSIFDRGPT